VALAIDDGRNHLLRARQPYDLIVADIIHPYNAGGNNLYSVEYFKLVARALAADGLMVQWVPLEDAAAHQLIVRTFLEAFPNSTLWLSTDVLVGSNQPITIDRERINQRLADPGAQHTLGDVGFVWREHVTAQYRGDSATLRSYAGAGPVLSDDRPLLEYFRTLDVPFGSR
jgi:spermidine synthase